MKNSKKENVNNPIYWIVIAVSVLIGTIIRFKGLGTWTLALDEYYIIKSSEYILEHGIPQFPNGGYYLRGILLQYMIAPLLSLGVKAELSGRIFTVVANLITIPAIYLIAKKVGNQLIATVVVVIFSFSIWEIEFARFARMYTPFQAIFMWYIYFALIDFSNNNLKNYKWMILLSTISFLVYEGSIFLAVFNFVPFIVNKKVNIKYIVFALLTFISSAFINLFDFRTLNSKPIFPPEFNETIRAGLASSPIKIPKILALFANDGLLASAMVFLLLILNIFLAFKTINILKSKTFWSVFSVFFLTLLALLNQFGLFILVLIVLLFWNLFEIKKVQNKVLLFLGAIFSINFVYWMSFGLLSANWYSLFNDFASYDTWGVAKRLLVGFFNYPDNYGTFLNYFRTLPLLVLFAAIFSSALVYYLIQKRDKNTKLKFLIGSLIFVCLIATIPTLLYQETRYTFFALPLLMIIVVFSVHHFSQLVFNNKSIVSLTLFLVVTFTSFIFSNDFNFFHLTNIDKAEVNYRMIYNNHIKKHLYRRWDISTPIDFVKNNLGSNDIVITNENSHDYYLPRIDYYSFDYMHHAFVALSVDEGRKERWSNTDLIYTNKKLFSTIENRKETIWFLVFPERYIHENNFYERYKDYQVSEGIDGLVKLYKFPKKLN